MNVSSKSKKAILSDGLSLDFSSGSFCRAPCPPPSGPLLRNVQSRSRRICPTRDSFHRQTSDKPKGPVFRLSLLFYLMLCSFGRKYNTPPSPPLLRNVQSHSRRICPTRESVHRQTTDKTKGPVFRLSVLFCFMYGSSLLSHGETPHYHRRDGVSRRSAAWGQVGPPRYGRQANSGSSHLFCVLI